MRLRTWILRALVVWSALVALGVYGLFAGWFVTKRSPAELSAMLRPFDVIAKPDGPGPFPTAILFHGCGGDWQQQRVWAGFLAQHGYAAVAVDSLSPRGIGSDEALRTVCKGSGLWGRERAGDVAVSLADVRALPFVDPRRIVLMGWSHGGWSIMDLLALRSSGGRPTNLNADPSGDLDGVVGLVFFYPYTGFGSLAAGAGWTLDVPILLLLAGNDSIAAGPPTLALAEVLKAQGHALTMETFPGVDHAFDVPELPPGGPLHYDAATTAAAQTRVLGFLANVTGRTP